jgi:hypothetical protein
VVRRYLYSEEEMKHKVFVDFPKSGLGNLLLIWSRAKVFSHINGLPLIASGWWGIRWGTWLRNENKKRMYWGYFHESPMVQKLSLYLSKHFYTCVSEPPVDLSQLPVKPTIFQFSETALYNDLFEPIRPHREFINAEIHKLLKPQVRKQLHNLEKPVIAVHIRRGDFKYGNPITPVSFFINAINFIRANTQRKLPVTVFTDAETEEIKDILAIENVHLSEKKPDILDILQMSRSKIIVLSQSSTFSYWAAFLSEAIVIKPFEDWQGDLRPADVNRRSFEGKICFGKPATLEQLAAVIKKEKW